MATSEEKLEALADLYLSLWKQMDLLSNDGKWLDLGPVDPVELQAHVERRIDDVRDSVQDSDMLEMVEKDYSRTQDLLRKAANERSVPPEAEDKELAAFKIYLRDQGLRYDTAASEAGQGRSLSAGQATR